VGAGAILQVIVEVTAYLMRSDGRGPAALTAPATMAGLAAGVSFMYVTAMLVKV
ncbi:MAG: metal transporter, partial [Mesorhizobium sp.]